MGMRKLGCRRIRILLHDLLAGLIFTCHHLIEATIINRVFVRSFCGNRLLLLFGILVDVFFLWDGVVLQKKLGHILCRIANLHQKIKQLNDCSMKSVKNRDLLGAANLQLQLSPESKTRTLSRSKASNQGGIRRQVLSPNPMVESVTRQVSISKLSRAAQPLPLQQSRMAASPDGQRSDILSKLQELMTMATSTAKENQCRKQRSPGGDEIYRKIEFNQWECDEIDKLKQELVKSYSKLKEVQKMHRETEKKTLLLQQAQQALEKELHAWKQRCAKKDDIIFNLEQRIVKLLSENEGLHQKVNQLSMSIVQERNASIQNLKQHLLAIERQGKELINASIPTLAPGSSPDQRIKDELELYRLEVQSRDHLLKQSKEHHENEKHRLQQQIQVLRLQLDAYKNLPTVSAMQLKKERERQEMYLLYIQASSIENLLKERQQ